MKKFAAVLLLVSAASAYAAVIQPPTPGTTTFNPLPFSPGAPHPK